MNHTTFPAAPSSPSIETLQSFSQQCRAAALADPTSAAAFVILADFAETFVARHAGEPLSSTAFTPLLDELNTWLERVASARDSSESVRLSLVNALAARYAQALAS